MKKRSIAIAAALASLMISPAFAAAYIKFDGVDGEAKSASFGRGSGGMQSLDLTTGEDPVAIGLLLPAVQKVREAASRASRAGRPKSFSSFEFSDGRNTYVLHDATAHPNGANRVKVLFRCKDWTDAAGKQGTDCARKGNVETEWKVEKGEK